MFHFAKQTTFTRSERAVFYGGRSIIVVLAILFAIKVVLGIILPRVTYSHAVPNTDPLFDLSEPISVGDGVQFFASSGNDIDSARLTVTSSTSLEGIEVILHKSHYAFFGGTDSGIQDIAMEASLPYPSGTLIRSPREYFVIDGNTKRPFNAPEALLASGYNFDDAVSAPSDERALYKKARAYDMRSTHPLGTIFHDVATGEYLRSAPSGVLAPYVGDPTSAIAVSSLDRATYTSCILKKKLLHNAYACDIDLTSLAHNLGKDFIFTLGGVTPQEIKQAKAILSVSATKQNVFSRLDFIKNELQGS